MGQDLLRGCSGHGSPCGMTGCSNAPVPVDGPQIPRWLRQGVSVAASLPTQGFFNLGGLGGRHNPPFLLHPQGAKKRPAKRGAREEA